MDCYIIPIGGTGSRVMRSITHLMACGALNKGGDLNDVHFMCVDSDAQNGDKVRMEQTVKNYMDIQRTGIIRKRINPPFATDPSRFTWSPLDVAASTMGNIENYGHMSNNVQELYDFLYTKEEKELELKGGFYSHTSIGSYYMTNGITDEHGAYIGDWEEFFATVKPEDLIIIICSMFGGTGASGVPTLARKIHETSRTKDCKIAGIFIEPYFRTPDADIIDSDTFNVKTKIAIEYYYNQNFDKQVFDRMYFVGDKNLMIAEHHIDGSEQINKANMVELYAATAVVDYINTNQAAEKVKVALRGTEQREDVFSGQMINRTAGVPVYTLLMNFMQFAVLYTKFLYHAIKQLDGKSAAERKNIIAHCGFINYYKFVDDNGNVYPEVDSLYQYCMKYMLWLREIITQESPDGKFPADYSWLADKDAEDNPNAKWIARSQYALYNGGPVPGGTYWEKCNNMDAYLSDAFPGYTKFIYGKTLFTTESIFKSLCDPPANEKAETKSLNRFIADVMKLSNKGTW